MWVDLLDSIRSLGVSMKQSKRVSLIREIYVLACITRCSDFAVMFPFYPRIRLSSTNLSSAEADACLIWNMSSRSVA